jgi:ATP-dependent DNA helicase RecG
MLYKGPLGETARARLEILRETEDGFRIAEEDLRLRGEGDVLGLRQAGQPGFRLANLDLHASLLTRAREQAKAAIDASARLAGDANRGLRLLLYVFERDEAVRLIEAG